MKLTGLHILLTYKCNYECDHCFVWGSPWQKGTFTLAQLTDVFHQAREIGTIREVYFEGGEPFLYHPILVEAVSRAKRMGYTVGIVSNGYWATRVEDAWLWLKPLVAAGLDRLEISDDAYHSSSTHSKVIHPALVAARELFLATATLSVDPPINQRSSDVEPGEPLVEGDVRFRGRAAEKLTGGLPTRDWTCFRCCPYEELEHPERVHLDPLGNLHICQGVIIGNVFERSLKKIIDDYRPAEHPIVGPIIAGGPAELARRYDVGTEPGYVDACHLCYSVRRQLRGRFPEVLGPAQMYGVVNGHLETREPIT
jgi:MoaA/NifB/PqqE/SkfB family radical SAM enzyme